MTASAPNWLFNRVKLSATLTTLSPMHVGSGEMKASGLKRLDDGREPLVAQVARGNSGAPLIMGASLKGALRTLMESTIARAKHGLNADDLFGEVSDTVTGRMGPLIVYDAPLASTPASSERPHYDVQSGVAIAARTAINPGLGAADRHKLFHAEEVAPGATFALAALYLPPSDADWDARARRLLALLLNLLTEGEIALGRSRGDGDGRIQVSNPSFAQMTFNPATGRVAWQAQGTTLALAPEDAKALAAAPATETIRLTLTAEEPFFVNDWAWDSKKAASAAGALVVNSSGKSTNKTEPQQRGLREADGKPILPGQSLMGALRARAAWLCALGRKRGDAGAPKEAAIQLLFGTEKQAGRLRLKSLALRQQFVAEHVSTGVKIDRHSGGTIDGALIGVEAFVEPIFDATLTVGELDPDARRALELLRKDLSKNGLVLGHGGARGYGRFKAEVKP